MVPGQDSGGVPVPVSLAWLRSGPEASSVDPTWIQDGALFVCHPTGGPLEVYLLLWVRDPSALTGALATLPWVPMPAGDLCQRLGTQRGSIGVLATVAIQGAPEHHGPILATVQAVLTAGTHTRKSKAGNPPGTKAGRKRSSAPATASGAPGTPSLTHEIRSGPPAGLVSWQPGSLPFFHHWKSILTHPELVPDLGPLADLGKERDASARQIPGALGLDRVLTKHAIDGIRGALDAIPGFPGGFIGVGSLGRITRIATGLRAPNLGAEILETSGYPALAHIALGVQWRRYRVREWVLTEPKWQPARVTRWNYSRGPNGTLIRRKLDAEPFDNVLTAKAIRGHRFGRGAVAVQGNVATTWTCIDLDRGHHRGTGIDPGVPGTDESHRASVVAGYRADIARIRAAFAEAIVEARMTRRDPEDPGLLAVKGWNPKVPGDEGTQGPKPRKPVPANLAMPTLFLTSRGPRHLDPDDPLTWVHGVHIWIRWAGWYPRDALADAMASCLEALGVGADGYPPEIFPSGIKAISLPLRVSPVEVHATGSDRGFQKSISVQHLDYVLVDDDLIPLLGVLRPGVTREDRTGVPKDSNWSDVEPKDFLKASEYLAQEWAHLDLNWKPDQPPPGAPAPVGIPGIKLDLGEPEACGGRQGYQMTKMSKYPFGVPAGAPPDVPAGAPAEASAATSTVRPAEGSPAGTDAVPEAPRAPPSVLEQGYLQCAARRKDGDEFVTVLTPDNDAPVILRELRIHASGVHLTRGPWRDHGRRIAAQLRSPAEGAIVRPQARQYEPIMLPGVRGPTGGDPIAALAQRGISSAIVALERADANFRRCYHGESGAQVRSRRPTGTPNGEDRPGQTRITGFQRPNVTEEAGSSGADGPPGGPPWVPLGVPVRGSVGTDAGGGDGTSRSPGTDVAGGSPAGRPAGGGSTGIQAGKRVGPQQGNLRGQVAVTAASTMETPAGLTEEIRDEIRHRGPRGADLQEFRAQETNDQLKALVQAVTWWGGSYADAVAVFDDIAAASTSYRGDLRGLRNKLDGMWEANLERLRSGKVKVRERTPEGPRASLSSEVLEWIASVVEAAAGTPEYRSTLRQERTREVWRSVLGALIYGNRGKAPEQWRTGKMTKVFLTGKRRTQDRGEIKSTEAPRFSDTRAAKLFKKWLQETGYVVKVQKTVIRASGVQVGPPDRSVATQYDLTGLMKAVPWRDPGT